jgi:phosphatidylinositol glycan class K
LSSQDLAGAFEQMRLKKRYNEVLFATDTCQAATLAKRITSSGVLSIGSSQRGENSWSHHNDDFLGCTVIDRFTYHTLELVESRGARVTLGELMRHLTFDRLHSSAKLDVRNYPRDPLRVPLRDFMGSVLHVDTRSVGELHIAGEPTAGVGAVPDALGAARLQGLYFTLDATF